MRVTKLQFGLLLILITAISFSALASNDLTITFSSSATIDGERVILGDIAQVAGSSKLADKVRRIDLGPAPRPGRKITIVPAMIYNALQRKRIDPESIKMIGLEKSGVAVETRAYLLDKDYVMQEVRNYLYDKFPQYQDLRIDLGREFPQVALPNDNYSIEVGNYSGDVIRARKSLPVNVLINGQHHKRIFLNLNLKVFDYVFVTKMPIDRKTIISSDMIERRYMNITGLYKEPVINEDDILGKEASRTLRKESIIYWNDVEKPQLIQRNDKVSIQVKYGSVSVQTMGIAKENGTKGELIWVENISSGKEVRAKVIDSGTVQITFK